MSIPRLDEQAELDACVAALRDDLRQQAGRLEASVDGSLRRLGVARHPFAALGLAAALGGGVAYVARDRGTGGLRRAGSLTLGALRLSGLLG